MEAKEELEPVIQQLEELKGDNTVPKNVKQKVTEILEVLSQEEDFSISISRVQNDLEEMANDTNMQPFTRTQIYNIISMMENLLA